MIATSKEECDTLISKQLVAHNFSRSSTEYESVALCQSYAAGRFAGMIADTIADKESTLRILEVGCGTGFLTKTLIGLFPHASITVCDISTEMLDICKQNTAVVRKQHGADVEFSQCDISTDSLTGQYDLVVSGMAFQWLESDLVDVIGKIRKHLTDDGHLMFSTLVDGTFQRLKESFKECGVQFPGPTLFSLDELTANLPQSSRVQFEVYKDYYPTVLAFLKQLKATGAVNATGQPVAPGGLRRIIRKYTELNDNKDTIAEYHIAYCFLKKL